MDCYILSIKNIIYNIRHSVLVCAIIHAKEKLLERFAEMDIDKAVRQATDTRLCVIGRGAVSSVPEVFGEQFPGARRAVVVADPRTWNAAGGTVEALLRGTGIPVDRHIIEPGGAQFHSEYRYVEEIKAAIGKGAVPVAVGSGTVNDLVKCAAGELGIPYMVVCTAASVDGYSSYGAAIVSPNGVKETYNCPAPRAIVADVDVLLTAPREMAAFGYADLMAKSPAGAEWILASEIGAEKWDDTAWHMVQDSLPDALGDAEGVARHDSVAIEKLAKGLMMGGFAMQRMSSSRPASGAEHRFSHILDMTHHTFNGRSCSHGEQVGVFTLYTTRFIEALLDFDMAALDVDRCVADWPEWDAGGRALAVRTFAGTEFPDLGVKEAVGKWQTKDGLRAMLSLAKEHWPDIATRIRAQLIPSVEVERRLKAAGAPSRPAEIGVADDFAVRHARYAMLMRFRFNVLDFAFRIGRLDDFAAQAAFGRGL